MTTMVSLFFCFWCFLRSFSHLQARRSRAGSPQASALGAAAADGPACGEAGRLLVAFGVFGGFRSGLGTGFGLNSTYIRVFYGLVHFFGLFKFFLKLLADFLLFLQVF